MFSGLFSLMAVAMFHPACMWISVPGYSMHKRGTSPRGAHCMHVIGIECLSRLLCGFTCDGAIVSKYGCSLAEKRLARPKPD